MVLLDCDDAASAGVQDAVSKPELALWRQRLGRLHRGAYGLPVQALVPAIMSRSKTSAHIVESGRFETSPGRKGSGKLHTQQ